MKKRKVKGEISGYNEFVAIRKELRKSIYKQEKSFNNDLLNIDNIYNSALAFLTRKKNKQKILDNSNIIMLSDLITRATESFVKSKKQKQVLLPVISLAVSYFAINFINRKFQKE